MSDSILDELNKAKADLDKATELQDIMKKANAIIRTGKNVTARLVEELKMSEGTAIKLQEKDFAGRTGFPGYRLTNNNASIRRLQDRVSMLEKKWKGARDSVKTDGKSAEKYEFETGPGGTIEVNYSIDRVQILFNGKPDEKLRTEMKRSGWKWSPTNSVWQRKITPQAINAGVRMLSATKITSSEAPEEIARESAEDDNPNFPFDFKSEVAPKDISNEDFKKSLLTHSHNLQIIEGTLQEVKTFLEKKYPVFEFQIKPFENYFNPHLSFGYNLYFTAPELYPLKIVSLSIHLKTERINNYSNAVQILPKKKVNLNVYFYPETKAFGEKIVDRNPTITETSSENFDTKQVMDILKPIDTEFSFHKLGINNVEEIETDPDWDPVTGRALKMFWDKYYPQGLANKFKITGYSFDDLKLNLTFKNGASGILDLSRNARQTDFSPDAFDALQDVQYWLRNAYNNRENHDTIIDNLKTSTKHWVSNPKTPGGDIKNIPEPDIDEMSPLDLWVKFNGKSKGEFRYKRKFQFDNQTNMYNFFNKVKGLGVVSPVNEENNSFALIVGSQNLVDEVNSLKLDEKIILENTTKESPLITATYKNQYLLNKAIEQLLDEKGETPASYSSEEKMFIKKYSGYGGLDQFGTTGKGGLFEYYTPREVIAKMWALAFKYGYNNGSVCEPSVATGEFFQFAKPDTRLVGYEISKYSAMICKILYPQSEIFLQPFEQLFIKNNWTVKDKIDHLEKFDLVIGNPPYGDFSIVESRYMSGMGEKDHVQPRNYVEYFLRRGVDLLKPNGLLIYIVGSQVKAGGIMFLDSGPSPVKEYLQSQCNLLDAYRLPDSVFERTGVTTDIIVLQKK